MFFSDIKLVQKFSTDEEIESGRLDENKLDSNVKNVLNALLVLEGAPVKDTHFQIAFKIIEHIYTNEFILDNEDKLSVRIAANLDKVF